MTQMSPENVSFVYRGSTLSYVFNNLVPGRLYTVSVTVIASSGSSSGAIERPLRTRELLIYKMNEHWR